MKRDYIYRAGNRLNYHEGKRSVMVGYFELRERYGRTSWAWTWASWATKDKVAVDWITAQLQRLNRHHSHTGGGLAAPKEVDDDCALGL